MTPRRALSAALLALAAATALAPARAAEPAPFRLEEQLPVSTLGLVAVDGFPSGFRAALATTPLGGLLGRAEVDAALRPLLELLRRGSARLGGGEELVAHFAPALAELDGRLEVALVGLERDGAPRVVASLDFGANLSRLVSFLEAARAALPLGWSSQAVPDAAPGGRAFDLTDGAHAWIVRLVGTTIVATNRGDLEPGRGGQGAKGASLAELPAFVGAFGDPARRDAASIRAYANAGALVARALEDPDGTVGARFAAAAGFDGLGTLAYRASVEDGAVTESLRLLARGTGKGAFALLRTSPLRAAAAEPASGRTWLRLETSLPVSTWPAAWRAFLHDADAEDEADFVRDFARLEHALGVDLATDVFPRLVDEQTLSIGLSDAGGAYPEVVLSIPVRDPAGLEPLLVRAVDGLCADRTERGDETVVQRAVRAGGRTMHVVEFRAADGAEPTPFTPTWAIVGATDADARLVVTPVPHTMRALLGRRAGAGGAPPSEGAADPALVAARAAGTALVLGTRDLLVSAYDTLVPLVETIPAWKREALAAGLDPASLPAAPETRAAFGDTIVSLKVDAAGVEAGARGPFGLVPLAGLVVASLRAAAADAPGDIAGASAGEPFASQSAASDDPRRVTSNVLDRIARALQEFVALRGAFPASLEELTTTERLLAAVPKDAWDAAFRYTPPKDGAPAVVASAGPDGVFGDDDDVTVDVEPPAK